MVPRRAERLLTRKRLPAIFQPCCCLGRVVFGNLHLLCTEEAELLSGGLCVDMWPTAMFGSRQQRLVLFTCARRGWWHSVPARPGRARLYAEPPRSPGGKYCRGEPMDDIVEGSCYEVTVRCSGLRLRALCAMGSCERLLSAVGLAPLSGACLWACCCSSSCVALLPRQ